MNEPIYLFITFFFYKLKLIIMDDVEKEIKIIIVGESFVGKTSLITKYCWNKFEDY